MSQMFRTACVQTNAAPEFAPNIEQASDLIRHARDAGADFITLPETLNIMQPDGKTLRQRIVPEGEDPTLAAMQDLARETGAWLLAGSILIRLPDQDGPKIMAANRSFLINGEGEIAARYDKMHMFDVDLGNGEFYRESSTYQPGDTPVVAETPWGKLGMTICYDVRFPYLYRHLAQNGAEILTVPAAFTRTTGTAHWHVLLRARAIETGCYVIAPAQCGDHAGNRQTYGHSLIIDPWGEVLADGGEDVGIVTADIDLSKVTEARSKIPSLTHDRDLG